MLGKLNTTSNQPSEAPLRDWFKDWSTRVKEIAHGHGEAFATVSFLFGLLVFFLHK